MYLNISTCRSAAMDFIHIVTEVLGGLAEDTISIIRAFWEAIGRRVASLKLHHLHQAALSSCGRLPVAREWLHRQPILPPSVDGLVYSFPGHGLWLFVAELAPQLRVTEEQKQIEEIVESAPHQVGKYRFQFRHRYRTGGNQVFIPFLVTGAGNELNTRSWHKLTSNCMYNIFPFVF